MSRIPLFTINGWTEAEDPLADIGDNTFEDDSGPTLPQVASGDSFPLGTSSRQKAFDLRIGVWAF